MKIVRYWEWCVYKPTRKDGRGLLPVMQRNGVLEADTLDEARTLAISQSNIVVDSMCAWTTDYDTSGDMRSTTLKQSSRQHEDWREREDLILSEINVTIARDMGHPINEPEYHFTWCIIKDGKVLNHGHIVGNRERTVKAKALAESEMYHKGWRWVKSFREYTEECWVYCEGLPTQHVLMLYIPLHTE